MTNYVSYDAYYADWTICDYLSDWSAYFGDVDHRLGSVDEGVNTGGFNPGPFTGTQYALPSVDSPAAFIAEGSALTYSYLAGHVLYGDLDTVQLGATLENSSGYSLTNLDVSFENLGLASGLGDGWSGIVHKVIYGLMAGDTSELSGVLEDLFADAIADYNSLNNTELTFCDITFEQLASVGAATEISTVGSSSVIEGDFALAA